MPSSLVQRIRIRQNAFWFDSRPAFATGGAVLSGYRAPRQTRRISCLTLQPDPPGTHEFGAAGDPHARNSARRLYRLRLDWIQRVDWCGLDRCRLLRLAARRPRRDRIGLCGLRLHRLGTGRAGAAWMLAMSRETGCSRKAEARMQRLGRARRFRIPRPRDREPLVEVARLSHSLARMLFDQTVVPQPGGLDVEEALQLLIDQLHPVAGDGPLPADPVDVAMQRHFRTFAICRARSPSAPPI